MDRYIISISIHLFIASDAYALADAPTQLQLMLVRYVYI